MTTLRAMLREGPPVFAPLVLNGLMARMAEEAGFRAIYLGGGASGYCNTFTEANLSLTEMCQAGLEIGSASRLPLILDGACGWGDPMHLHRSIALAERAGFQAIEIEDQILPKRAHHHIGIEHVIAPEEMAAKVREAVAVRRSPDFLVIARTNAARMHGLDDALRRAELMAEAGADLLFLLTREPEELRAVAERFDLPLMYMPPAGGLAEAGLGTADLEALRIRLVVDAQTPLLAMHRALRDCYAALREGAPDPLVGGAIAAENKALKHSVGLERLLEVERRTVER
ncbi:isocitrate lyase/PEP mutase family protein [Sabulicella glaciei]|uniref:Isocitrate lyase/PEP mutase family protein n=1 Tax=Sabulicella glaciei TaxID=2984948 RepID=A0ABT3NTG5_9PROT|nr:isocitrate lyase/PEP mutase family protein [Roseococcus sp. MDT2-1-1]MCW8085454.1 isocitrate lyase/PEP mutase family protein [Roseococcus sp. MDT2-1-1]